MKVFREDDRECRHFSIRWQSTMWDVICAERALSVVGRSRLRNQSGRAALSVSWAAGSEAETAAAAARLAGDGCGESSGRSASGRWMRRAESGSQRACQKKKNTNTEKKKKQQKGGVVFVWLWVCWVDESAGCGECR